mgnify:CR=1 FL=1
MNRYRPLVVAFALLIGVNLALAGGYWLLNQGRANPDGTPVDFLQCLYMTVITTFTVGYGEVIPIVTPFDKIYTMLAIVMGLGTMGYGSIPECGCRRGRSAPTSRSAPVWPCAGNS